MVQGSCSLCGGEEVVEGYTLEIIWVHKSLIPTIESGIGRYTSCRFHQTVYMACGGIVDFARWDISTNTKITVKVVP
jgi:hypothetical protein